MARWLAALLLAIVIAVPAAAQEQQIGQISTTTGAVTVERAGQHLPLKIGDPIYQKDVIETGKDSTVGIIFVDNSVFSTGPESRLALDQFHFDFDQFSRRHAGQTAKRHAERGVRRHRPQFAGGHEDPDADGDSRRPRYDLRGCGPLGRRRGRVGAVRESGRL